MRIQQSFSDDAGPCLYVCSTPIGNLQDVTLRLLTVLTEADVIAAEDTRQTRKLLTHFEIHPKQLISYHKHNELARQKDLELWWADGKRVALVSDAGTPAVSDPGFAAVQFAVAKGIPVIPIPGASASLAALVASGLAPQPFLFVGFLPRGERQRQEVLQQYSYLHATLIFYESPYRIASVLKSFAKDFSRREITLARELTKRYESFVSGTLQEVTDYIASDGARGEFVIVVGPPEKVTSTSGDDEDEEEVWQRAIAAVAKHMQSGMSHREAVAHCAKELGVKRRELYQATLESPRGD